MTRGARWVGADGGSKRSEWVDEEEALGDEFVWECVAAVCEASERRLAVRDNAGDMDETRECVVAAAENVSGEGVSDGDDVDATDSPVHSMRTRLFLLSGIMTLPWRSTTRYSGTWKRAWSSGTLSTNAPGVVVMSPAEGPEPASVRTLPFTRIIRTRCS